MSKEKENEQVESSRSGEDILQIYLREIRKEKLLTAEEECDLARRARKGDKEAREKLIRSNLRLVVSIARHYTGWDLPLADLVEEGNVGLIMAVEKFDPDKGFRFSTYATWWIKHTIKRALLEARMVRVPPSLLELAAEWKAVEARIFAETGKHPSFEEVAKRLKVSKRQMKPLRLLMGESGVLGGTVDAEMFTPSTEEDTADIVDRKESTRRLMEQMHRVISPREEDMLKRYYGLDGETPQTLKQIGDHYGISRERVRQVIQGALKKLHRHLAREEEE